MRPAIVLAPPVDPTSIWHWAYVLEHWKSQEAFFLYPPVQTYKEKTLRTVGTVPEGMRVALFQPKNGKHISGNINMKEYDFSLVEGLVFGPDDKHLTEAMLERVQIVNTVYIDTDTDTQMYSFLAASLALYKIRNG